MHRFAWTILLLCLTISPFRAEAKGIAYLLSLFWPKPTAAAAATAAPQPVAATAAATVAAVAAAPSVSDPLAPIKEDVLSTATALADDLMAFWTRHGVDKEKGGFFGTVDQRGAPVAPYEKGLVNQARRLWTWSSAYATMQPRQQQQFADMARAAAAFLLRHFIKQQQPGGTGGREPRPLAVWAVSRDGSNVTDASLSLYGNFFAVFALARQAQVFQDQEAATLALQLFRSIDERWHDKQAGGYDESSSRPVFDLHQLPRTNKTTKSFDTQMHAIEALGQLYVTSGDPTALARLLEMLQVIGDKAIVRLNGTDACRRVRDWQRPAGIVVPPATASPTNSSGWISLSHLLSSREAEVSRFMLAAQARTAAPQQLANCSFICAGFDAGWGCLPSTNNPILVNVGHNLEAVHLFTGIIDELLQLQAIPAAQAASLKQKLVDVGVTTAAWGYDSQFGGVTQPGYFAKLPPYTKVYWVQAEAMQAFWTLFKATGEPQYLTALQKTIRFVDRHMRDGQHGEWFYQVLSNGSLPANPGPLLKSLATSKADYHEMRSMMNLMSWIREDLQQ